MNLYLLLFVANVKQVLHLVLVDVRASYTTIINFLENSRGSAVDIDALL